MIKITKILIVLMGISLGGCSYEVAKDSDNNFNLGSNSSTTENTVEAQFYNKHKPFIEGLTLYDWPDFESKRIKEVKLYSVRNKGDELEYTLDVITEKSLEAGDAICIKEKYDLVVAKEDAFIIKSLAPVTPFMANKRQQVPYLEYISSYEEEQILVVMNILLNKDQTFFSHYERNWLKGYDKLEGFLSEAPALRRKIEISEENYQEAYSLNLSPYQIPDEEIVWHMENIKLFIEDTMSKKIHPVKVNIIGEVLRDYNNKLYYNYEYLVVLNDGKINSIRFIKREPVHNRKELTT